MRTGKRQTAAVVGARWMVVKAKPQHPAVPDFGRQAVAGGINDHPGRRGQQKDWRFAMAASPSPQEARMSGLLTLPYVPPIRSALYSYQNDTSVGNDQDGGHIHVLGLSSD